MKIFNFCVILEIFGTSRKGFRSMQSDLKNDTEQKKKN